jgi:hypothetical protein
MKHQLLNGTIDRKHLFDGKRQGWGRSDRLMDGVDGRVKLKRDTVGGKRKGDITT